MIGPNVIHIHSPDPAIHPLLADYADLTGHTAEFGQPAREGTRPFFIAEGEFVVRRLLASTFPVRSILLTPREFENLARPDSQLAPLLRSGTTVFVAPDAVMETLIGFSFHRGIMASGARPTAADPKAWLADRTSLVVLEDLANHDNLGSIFRNAAALGGSRPGVLLSPRCADPLYRKSIRVSMGNVLHVPYSVLAPWPLALADLKKQRYRIAALTPAEGAIDIRNLPQLHSGERWALLAGAEGPGLTNAAMSSADIRVRIDINPSTDSINVAAAVAIALHQIPSGGLPSGGVSAAGDGRT